jgi:hypothetical protein
MTLSDKLWRVDAAVIALAAAMVTRRLILARRQVTPAARLGARRARALILEHPQSLALLLLTLLVLPLPFAALGWSALALAPSGFGLYLFLPVAALSSAALLAAAGGSAYAVAFFASRRLRGEKPAVLRLPGLWLSLASDAAGWLGSQFGSARDPAPTLLAASIMLADGMPLAAASKRASVVATQAPDFAELLKGAGRKLALTSLVLLGMGLPLCLGLYSLPVTSFVGFKMELIERAGLEGYKLALAGAGAAGAIVLAWWALACASAFVHAAAAYIYASAGSNEARERVTARFEPEVLRPQAGPTRQPSSAQAAAASPAPAPPSAPAPAAPAAPPPASPFTAEPLQPFRSEAPSRDAFEWGPGQSASYAAERMAPPAAGSLPPAELGSGPAAFSWEQAPARAPELETRSPTTARRVPDRSSLGSRAAKGLLRIVLVCGLAGASVWIWSFLDGPAVLRRQGLLVNGISTWATIESIEPVPRYGLLTYSITFSYQAGGTTRRGRALAGDSAGGALRRGQNVLARLLADQPDYAVLQEDFGYSAQRGAMLVAVLVVLLAGGWSFIFKVI